MTTLCPRSAVTMGCGTSAPADTEQQTIVAKPAPPPAPVPAKTTPKTTTTAAYRSGGTYAGGVGGGGAGDGGGGGCGGGGGRSRSVPAQLDIATLLGTPCNAMQFIWLLA